LLRLEDTQSFNEDYQNKLANVRNARPAIDGLTPIVRRDPTGAGKHLGNGIWAASADEPAAVTLFYSFNDEVLTREGARCSLGEDCDI